MNSWRGWGSKNDFECPPLIGLRHPASASCLGRHSRLAGRCPNNSSLFPPLAAVVVVASHIHATGRPLASACAGGAAARHPLRHHLQRCRRVGLGRRPRGRSVQPLFQRERAPHQHPGLPVAQLMQTAREAFLPSARASTPTCAFFSDGYACTDAHSIALAAAQQRRTAPKRASPTMAALPFCGTQPSG